jgi:hypothetical protein
MTKRKPPVKKKRGPPSKFKPQTRRRVIEAITLGCTYEIAASYAGISESTLFRWLASGRDEEDKQYTAFYRSVKEAEAVSAVRNLASIAQAAKDGQWAAAAWLLERRHGYIKEPDRPMIDITVEMQNADVVGLIDQIQEQALTELITGPVIDIDEE